MSLALVRCGDNANIVASSTDDGGLVGSGGAPGSGGGVATGGAPGSGGGITTGGAPGSGGGIGMDGAAGTGGSAGTAGSGGGSSACVDPKDLTDPPSGYLYCANRMIHRAEKHDCPQAIPRAALQNDAGASCHADADCTEKPHGYCESWSNLAGSGWTCLYGCVRDDECAAGQICMCGPLTGRCVDAGCTVDADCGGALLCVGYYDQCQDNGRFECQSPADECGGELDCRVPSCGVCECEKNGGVASCMSRCADG